MRGQSSMLKGKKKDTCQLSLHDITNHLLIITETRKILQMLLYLSEALEIAELQAATNNVMSTCHDLHIYILYIP